MKKTALAAFTILFTFTPQASANFSYTPKNSNKVGIYLGGQIWQSETNGTFGEENSLIDANLKKEQQKNYFVAVVHPFSLLPNARISSSSLDTSGKTTLTQEFSFGDETFSNSENINTNFNVSYVDYTLYYQLLDNRKFSLDLGLTARDFNGDVTVTGETIIVDDEDDCSDPDPSPAISCPLPSSSIIPTGKIKTDDIVPMLYIATNFSLPLKKVIVFAQGNFSLKDDHSISNYQVGLSYDLLDTKVGDYHLTLGYKVVKIELENLNNLYTDLEFKGTFVGFIAHF